MKKTTSLDQIQEALAQIPANDRDICIKVGMAIHSELGDGGYNLWDSWLSRGSNYNQDDMRRAWKSFSSGSITIATVFYLAKQNDYNY